VRSYTVTLTSEQTPFLPQILDHYLFVDPISGSTFVYPTTADGFSAFDSSSFYTNSVTVTADDENMFPWGYAIQDVITNIIIPPFKGPRNIIFSPAGLDTTQRSILKIIYDFGDGTSTTINRTIVTPTNIGDTLSAGSPNATSVSHVYYPSNNTGITVYKPTITVYNSNIVRNIFNISISAAPMSIYELDDVHLINNVQPHTSNETQNILEVVSPNHLTTARVVSSNIVEYPTVIPFNPNTALPNYNYNLILWLDAGDAFTISKDYDNNVVAWLDKSAYRNDFYTGPVQPKYTYNRQALSLRKNVAFSNNASMFTYGSPSFDSIFYGPNSKYGFGYTLFVVMKANTVDGTLFSYDINAPQYNNVLIPNLNISLTGANSFVVQQGDTSYVTNQSGIYQPTVVSNISYNLSSYSLFSVMLSGTTNDFLSGAGSLNAYAAIGADTLLARRRGQNYIFNINSKYDPNISLVRIGASGTYPTSTLADAEVSEILLFNTPLDPTACAAIQEYLVNKWKLTLQTN